MDLKGKAAIVTGGSKGIGRGIAEALIRAGLNVLISARNQDEIDRAVAELNELGGRWLRLRCARSGVGEVAL
jgi:3-oxoacyl-[acyl-carrier protein] reductase